MVISASPAVDRAVSLFQGAGSAAASPTNNLCVFGVRHKGERGSIQRATCRPRVGDDYDAVIDDFNLADVVTLDAGSK